MRFVKGVSGKAHKILQCGLLVPHCNSEIFLFCWDDIELTCGVAQHIGGFCQQLRVIHGPGFAKIIQIQGKVPAAVLGIKVVPQLRLCVLGMNRVFIAS